MLRKEIFDRLRFVNTHTNAELEMVNQILELFRLVIDQEKQPVHLNDKGQYKVFDLGYNTALEELKQKYL